MKRIQLFHRELLSAGVVSMLLLLLACLVFPNAIVPSASFLSVASAYAIKSWCNLPGFVQKLPVTLFLFYLFITLTSPEYNHEIEHHHNHDETMKGWLLLHRRRKIRRERMMLTGRTLAGVLCFITAVIWGIAVEVIKLPVEKMGAFAIVVGLLSYGFKRWIHEWNCRIFMQISPSHHERIDVGQPHPFDDWVKGPGGKTVVQITDWEVVERGLISVAFKRIVEVEAEAEDGGTEEFVIEEYMNINYSELLFGRRKYGLPRFTSRTVHTRAAGRSIDTNTSPAAAAQRRTTKAKRPGLFSQFNPNKADTTTQPVAGTADQSQCCAIGEDVQLTTLTETDIKRKCKQDMEKCRSPFPFCPLPQVQPQDAACTGECRESKKAAKSATPNKSSRIKLEDPDDHTFFTNAELGEDDDDDEDPIDCYFGA